MRVLRAACFTSPTKPDVVVVRDCDVTDTLESIRVSATETATDGLVLTDLFEVPDGTSMEEATLIAGRRTAEQYVEYERHQILLYFWLIGQWQLMRPRGMVGADIPNPMTAQQMRVVLEALARRSDYRGFGYTAVDKDGTAVTLHDGKITP